jgi:hypothetical protein
MTVIANPTYTQPYAVSDIVSWEEGSAKYSRSAPDYDGSITGSFTVYHNAAVIQVGEILQWTSNGYVILTIDGGSAWNGATVTSTLGSPRLIIALQQIPISASGTTQVTGVASHAVIKKNKLYLGAAMTAATGTLVANKVLLFNWLAKQGVMVSPTA